MRETKEKLVTENLRLAGFMAKRFRNAGIEWDELQSLCYLGLVEAADRFDPKKGKFATIACICMQNQVLKTLRDQKRKYIPTVSTSASISAAEDLQIEDMLFYEEPGFRCIEHEDLLAEIQKLPEKESVCIRMWLDHVRQADIAQRVGVTPSYVSRLIKSGAKKEAARLSLERRTS